MSTPLSSVDAAPKIAGAGLSRRYFRSRVLYLGGNGKMELSPVGSYENSQNNFTLTAGVKIASAGLTMLYFHSRVYSWMVGGIILHKHISGSLCAECKA